MLTAVVGVVVLLGGLIFFHELGHFLVAKSFGVRVEVFSLGFGKKLLKKQWGETEYCLSLFPLGGYVKLMGDDPYKDIPADQAHRAFSTQALYKRFLIVAAGPMANLLLAYVLFAVVLWVGKPLPSSVIGHVEHQSKAWVAGFRSQDRITDIDGQPIASWPELSKALKNRTGETAQVRVEREGAELVIPTTVSQIKVRNQFGETVAAGGIEGISGLALAAKVGVSNPNSTAHKAGIRSGDVVTKVGNQPIKHYADLQKALLAQASPGKPVTLTVRRPEANANKPLEEYPEQSFSVVFPKTKDNSKQAAEFAPASQLGLYPTELFVLQVNPASPAEAGGLKPGDRITGLDGTAVFGFNAISETVQKRGNEGKNVVFNVERGGEQLALTLAPEQMDQEDPLTHAVTKKYMVGFAPMTTYQRGELTKLQIHNPIALIGAAVNEANTLAKQMVVSLGKLAMGQISVKNLGGPVLIASVAGKSLDAGIIPFLQMMALISINLFLLNLFPIPVLDGGHLLFFTIEAIQRKPVSIRTMEIANQMGMVFILLLVGLTLFNDISRIVTN